MTPHWNHGWSSARWTIVFVLIGCVSPSAMGADDAVPKFEKFAGQVRFFGSILYNNSPFGMGPPTPEATAMDKQFALLVSGTSNEQLEGLLKHPDAKIRTLALAALFQKEDPQVLPFLVSLTGDPAETFPKAYGPGQAETNYDAAHPPLGKQAVGEIASALLEFYMKPAGYFWGPKPENGQPGFDDYWLKRKDRKYCASWFEVWLERALHGMRPGSADFLPEVTQVRKKIDELPPDDRVLTLLWMRGVYPDGGPGYPNMLITEDDLIKVLKELGPDKLLQILQRRFKTDDPDMQMTGNGRNYSEATQFLLRHAVDLFRPQDAEAILVQGHLEPYGDRRDAREMAGWWIAAAELRPEQADVILREGIGFFSGELNDVGQQSQLAVALEKTSGRAADQYLVEWFYRPNSDKMAMIYDHSRQDFIDGIAKLPLGKKLIARILDNSKAKDLTLGVLAAIARNIDNWVAQPIMSNEEWFQLTGFHGKGQKNDPEIVPGFLERLQKSEGQWNR